MAQIFFFVLSTPLFDPFIKRFFILTLHSFVLGLSSTKGFSI
ncbi:hypothetical protein LEP1GSC097_1481, partial [Leptospira interrogans serovar Grippotyphosa str. UI 08368]